jgi:sigma-54 specific flagellar transcriptional regulator A
MPISGQKTLLIVDNNEARRTQIETVLAFIGERFSSCTTAQLSEEVTQIENPLAIIVTGELTSDVVEVVKSHPSYPFILYDVLDRQPVQSLVNVIGELKHPLNYAQLTELIHHCHQYHNKLPSRQNNRQNDAAFRSLVGASSAMLQVRFLIEQVASTNANVLILGESGTGKEVVARNIHDLSDRARHPFVPINCGAIPGELLESELFGHEKGAFTGAFSARKGRFELAEGGTLFLDEIGDMPQPMQVKLLRVLQERTFERVGGSKSIQANVRIIAATHQNLEEMIKSGDFREDLYYRLNVFPIETPALRDRKEDIPLLLQELLKRFEQEQGRSVRFTEKALESLKEHTWAGNVRELANLIERMLIMYGDQIVDVAELPSKYQHIDAESYQPQYPEELQERDAINALFADYDLEESATGVTTTLNSIDNDNDNDNKALIVGDLPAEGINLKDYLAELEVSLIEQALAKHDGVVARAAETLGMRRTTLVEKMRKYDLQKPAV